MTSLQKKDQPRGPRRAPRRSGSGKSRFGRRKSLAFLHRTFRKLPKLSKISRKGRGHLRQALPTLVGIVGGTSASRENVFAGQGRPAYISPDVQARCFRAHCRRLWSGSTRPQWL
jgi:hypothetical protein